MQIVVLIPLTHPSCMTGQPAPLSVCLKDSCPNQTFCQQRWGRVCSFLELLLSLRNCNHLGKQSGNCTWNPHGVFVERLLTVPIRAGGKKPHNVRLRTSRFLYNLLNICSWSTDMAKVEVWGFFFTSCGDFFVYSSLKTAACFEMHFWLQ